MLKTQVQSLGEKDPLKKEMATHSSILAWEIPWTEEPGRLQSMGLQRVRYNLATKQQWIHRLADLTDETHALISLNRMIYFAATKTSS